MDLNDLQKLEISEEISRNENLIFTVCGVTVLCLKTAKG